MRRDPLLRPASWYANPPGVRIPARASPITLTWILCQALRSTMLEHGGPQDPRTEPSVAIQRGTTVPPRPSYGRLQKTSDLAVLCGMARGPLSASSGNFGLITGLANARGCSVLPLLWRWSPGKSGR